MPNWNIYWLQCMNKPRRNRNKQSDIEKGIYLHYLIFNDQGSLWEPFPDWLWVWCHSHLKRSLWAEQSVSPDQPGSHYKTRRFSTQAAAIQVPVKGIFFQLYFKLPFLSINHCLGKSFGETLANFIMLVPFRHFLTAVSACSVILINKRAVDQCLGIAFTLDQQALKLTFPA